MLVVVFSLQGLSGRAGVREGLTLRQAVPEPKIKTGAIDFFTVRIASIHYNIIHGLTANP